MRDLVLVGWDEAIAAHVESLGLGYTGGTNMAYSAAPFEVWDIDDVAFRQATLVIYLESSTLTVASSCTRVDRVVRMVVKDTSPSKAVRAAERLFAALWNRRRFSDANFTATFSRAAKLPSVMSRNQDGSALADFVIEYLVLNKKEKEAET